MPIHESTCPGLSLYILIFCHFKDHLHSVVGPLWSLSLLSLCLWSIYLPLLSLSISLTDTRQCQCCMRVRASVSPYCILCRLPRGNLSWPSLACVTKHFCNAPNQTITSQTSKTHGIDWKHVHRKVKGSDTGKGSAVRNIETPALSAGGERENLGLCSIRLQPRQPKGLSNTLHTSVCTPWLNWRQERHQQ